MSTHAGTWGDFALIGLPMAVGFGVYLLLFFFGHDTLVTWIPPYPEWPISTDASSPLVGLNRLLISFVLGLATAVLTAVAVVLIFRSVEPR